SVMGRGWPRSFLGCWPLSFPLSRLPSMPTLLGLNASARLGRRIGGSGGWLWCSWRSAWRARAAWVWAYRAWVGAWLALRRARGGTRPSMLFLGGPDLAGDGAGCVAVGTDLPGIARGGATYQDGRLRRLGLGTLGRVGVTGMALGGPLAGRPAACLASASRT